jgi:hypothetical protein
MEFDAVDAALTMALAVSGFIMVGIAQFELFSLDFGEVMWSSGSIELTLAYIISVAGLVGTVLTNDNAALDSLTSDVTNLDDYYKYTVVAVAVVMVAWLFIPQVSEFFQSSDIWGLLYVAAVTTAQFALGWML